MTYRAHKPLENHHKNGYNANHFYHFQITITESKSESIEMCKIVHFHGFQHPKFRVHPAPEVHNFGADILARQMFFRGPAPDVCIK